MNRLVIFGAVGIVTFLSGLMISGGWLSSSPRTPKPVEDPKTKASREAKNARSILEKAIAAHGGADKLEKYQIIRSKSHGTMMINNFRCAVSGHEIIERPDKIRQVFSALDGVIREDVIMVLNGAKLWATNCRNKMNYELTSKRVIDACRHEMQLECYCLGDFLAEGYELTNLGEFEVRGNDTIGIRATKKGQNDTSFYFHKGSYLTAKVESRVYDLGLSREADVERFILSYMTVDGVRHPQRVEVRRDRRFYSDLEITEIAPLESVDESVFAKP
jgi:hypothetical protein